MIKIPQNDKRIIVTQGKEAFAGTLAFTKNINLDEAGYIKLSAPMAQIFSSEDDANFEIPVSIFTFRESTLKVITDGKTYNINLASLAVTEDTGFTTGQEPSRVFVWVSGNWFINGSDAVYDYTGAVNGVSVYTSRIAALLEYINLFVNKNTLVGSNGSNTLKQYNASFAGTTDLVIPANFVITGAKYSNNQMGVITRQAKNTDNAYFFIWDGNTAAANAGYPLNDSFLIGIDAYKSSWVILTSAGELLYFNGGGFDTLGQLAHFDREDEFLNLSPSTTTDIRDIIQAEGDKVYFNAPSLPQFSKDNKAFVPFASGGIYCFDPDASFYHRHAPSYSYYQEEDTTAASDICTFAQTHFLETGDPIFISDASTNGGLSVPKTYYAIKQSSTTIKIATSYANAMANTAVTLVDGTVSIHYIQRRDYGMEALRFLDLGGIKKDKNLAGYLDTFIDPFFMGAAIRPADVGTARVNVLCTLVPLAENRGYFVTGRFQSENIEDNWQYVAIKYDRLKNGDKIVVKANTQAREPIVIGDSGLFDDSYSGDSVTWIAADTFETSFDLSEAEVGDEVHVFDGAMAGQSAHIKSINTTGGTYTIQLDESLRGYSGSKKSCVVVSKFKKLGVITKDDTAGYKKFAIAEGASPTVEVKVELRGVGVKVSEVQVINNTHEGSI